jgi:hypothetical protein
MASPSRRPHRDPRVDLLRGVALLTIFVDHVPGNLLGYLTFRNFGFSDAAELFVVLAGFSSMMAYGGAFERDGSIWSRWGFWLRPWRSSGSGAAASASTRRRSSRSWTAACAAA